MDYLPNLEMLSITRVGPLGKEYSVLWRIDEVESFCPNDLYEDLGMVFRLNKFIDINLGYRHKKTGEMIMFDKEGIWNWEGVSHPHLTRD